MNPASLVLLDHVSCPFCGLLCDDLSVTGDGKTLAVVARGCDKSRVQFGQAFPANAPCVVDGNPVSLDAAIERATAILRSSTQPLLLSGGADVASMRALLALADRCGAVVDHTNEGLMRNILVLQDSGWITTTLTEIRNRADLVLCVGTDVVSRFPRFFERCGMGGGMLGDQRPAPEVIFLSATPPAGINARTIDVAPNQIAEVFAVLRALVNNKKPQRVEPQLEQLAQRIQRARYGVVVWSAADFDFSQAELTIQAICEWVKDLNKTIRFAGLPLGGNQGDISAHQTITWQSGFPLRTRFTAQGPDYDPHRYAARRLLATDAVDALLYIAEFDSNFAPPATTLPSIVLGRAGMLPPPCTVFIPVGTPGIDRSGHLYRTDNVVAVPLKKLTERGAYSAPQVLNQMTGGLACFV